MLVGGFLAGVYSLISPPSYSATAVITLLTLPDNPLSTGTSTKVVNTATESQVVRSTAIAKRVAVLIGSDDSATDLISHVTITAPLNSQALQISYAASSGKAAAQGANAFANAYLSYRSATVDQQVSGIAKALDAQIASLNTQQEKAQITALNGATDVLRANAKVSVKTLASVLQQLREQRAQLDNASHTAGQLVGQAEVPGAPSNPSIVILLIAGLAVGFVGGMALALIRDRTDDHVRSRDQIESDLQLPVVAEIPLGRDPYGKPTPVQSDMYRRLAAIITSTHNVAGISPLLLVAAGDPGRRDIAAKLSSAIAGQLGSTSLICAPSAVAVNLSTAQMGIWHSSSPQVESFGPETELRNGQPLNPPVDDVEMIVIDGINVEYASTPLILTSVAHSVLIVARIGTTRMIEISDLVRELEYTGAHIQGVVLLHSSRKPAARGQAKREPGYIPAVPPANPLPGGSGPGSGSGAGPGSGGSGDRGTMLPTQAPIRAQQQSAGFPDKGPRAGWEESAPMTQPIAVLNGKGAKNGAGSSGGSAGSSSSNGSDELDEQKPAKFMRLPSVREK